jgi:ATP-binding cassette subfamily B protein
MRQFGSGRTVIVIAHRLSTIAGADQVIVLNGGMVTEVRLPRPLAVRES